MANWLIPCNPTYYDVFSAFRTLKTVDWRQTAKNITAGDTVYIYTSKPVQAITHKCVVLSSDIPSENVDNSDAQFYIIQSDQRRALPSHWRYMRLQLVKEYVSNAITYSEILDCGLKGSLQGQRHIWPLLQDAIDSADNDV